MSLRVARLIQVLADTPKSSHGEESCVGADWVEKHRASFRTPSHESFGLFQVKKGAKWSTMGKRKPTLTPNSLTYNHSNQEFNKMSGPNMPSVPSTGGFGFKLTWQENDFQLSGVHKTRGPIKPSKGILVPVSNRPWPLLLWAPAVSTRS